VSTRTIILLVGFARTMRMFAGRTRHFRLHVPSRLLAASLLLPVRIKRYRENPRKISVEKKIREIVTYFLIGLTVQMQMALRLG
jgi:hypothetical protein